MLKNAHIYEMVEQEMLIKLETEITPCKIEMITLKYNFGNYHLESSNDDIKIAKSQLTKDETKDFIKSWVKYISTILTEKYWNISFIEDEVEFE